MQTLRRRLRVLAAAWLVFQAASLSALVPRDCCAAHRPAAPAARPCHQEAAPAPHCPMPSADGVPCPMHQTGRPGPGEAPDTSCRLRGACAGPMAALFTMLSSHGVLSAPPAVLPVHLTSAVVPGPPEALVSRLPVPDSPPPRA